MSWPDEIFGDSTTIISNRNKSIQSIPCPIAEKSARNNRGPRLFSRIFFCEFQTENIGQPGPYESEKPRGYLALTNSLQIPYLFLAAIKLLVAANVLSPNGSARLSKQKTEALYMLHPGFMFRDSVIGRESKGPLLAGAWVSFFSTLSSRVHAEATKNAPLWRETASAATLGAAFECVNGHPIQSPGAHCETCGATGTFLSPVAMLLDKDIDVLDLSDAIKTRLRTCYLDTVRKVFEATDEQINDIGYIGEARLQQIRSAVSVAVDEFIAK